MTYDITKTLFLSDMDGTLLTPGAVLSETAARELRRMIGQGLRFSIATGRIKESVREILGGILPLPVPLVLLNGTLVYDSASGQLVKKEQMAAHTVREVLRLAREHRQNGFLYTLEDDAIRPYYREPLRPVMRAFMRDRWKVYGGFVPLEDWNALADADVVYFTVQDSYGALEPLYRDLKELPELDCALYRDIYHEGNWFLECFSCRASKYNAACWLRETFGFTRVVGFGDNHNDLPLFAACDESYAVANAPEEIRAAATGVIGANTEDGVVRFLRERTLLGSS
ncbi:MAG: Cof-type HAD-IIB family hydrolase [Oscillospiraceae bacterium]|jgi:Cof subfamily protein (haloacid dehalogenase superfamily)|nr:Cof-type HAD-IIB family hydrolase [Oscillospiraceae bacterium]